MQQAAITTIATTVQTVTTIASSAPVNTAISRASGGAAGGEGMGDGGGATAISTPTPASSKGSPGFDTTGARKIASSRSFAASSARLALKTACNTLVRGSGDHGERMEGSSSGMIILTFTSVDPAVTSSSRKHSGSWQSSWSARTARSPAERSVEYCSMDASMVTVNVTKLALRSWTVSPLVSGRKGGKEGAGEGGATGGFGGGED
eukprot:scaffold63954_cov23-Tisochrysis_lutea.AAC.1